MGLYANYGMKLNLAASLSAFLSMTNCL